mmetsp:Transcript_16776/g.39918  ORF Transcript_16776/g.39918 Transcript_16776/m.39918 type:complete len:87 (-) Transcript_16776:173-433(-)
MSDVWQESCPSCLITAEIFANLTASSFSSCGFCGNFSHNGFRRRGMVLSILFSSKLCCFGFNYDKKKKGEFQQQQLRSARKAEVSS